MVAYAPYVAASASLSSVYHAYTPYAFRTAQICPPVVTTTITEYAAARPTTNAHGHGGPYYNPYNDVSHSSVWPGTPVNGETQPTSYPTATPYVYGGLAKSQYDAPAWIPKGSNKLSAPASNYAQNGNSKWGLIDCPRLPLNGLSSGTSNSSYASGSALYPYSTASGYRATGTVSPYYSANSTQTAYGATGTGTTTSACPTMPSTGVTRTYELHVAYQTIAPDGVKRNGLTINGQYPGPLIEANWGDWIKFEVTNDLTDEGTAIHAHGLLQTETSWYDGVPAVAQCPITPNGGTYTMLFRADRYGSSWYHSHFSAQYSGGAHGPMVIYGPKHVEYDLDVGPVILADWYHPDYFTLVNNTMHGNVPFGNNMLINGRMNYPCANTTLPCTANAGVSKFKFESGKKHLLRLMNTGAEATQKFSIDGHQLKVIAVDFVPIEPYTTNVVTLTIGQRADVIVEGLTNSTGAFWMRGQSARGSDWGRCSLNDGISPDAVAAVYYEDADTDSVPTTTNSVTAAQLASCLGTELTDIVPVCRIAIKTPDVTEELPIEFKSNGTNFVWYIDNSTFRGDFNSPPLLMASKGETDFADEWNVHQYTGAENVRLHFINNAIFGAHPIHLHGHDFHVLAEGYGTWDGEVTNAANTPRRDVHLLQSASNATGIVEPAYMVIQFVQDNPGAWPLHCHLAWHVSAGLFMQILERPDDIKKQTFDSDVFTLCDTWDKYTSTNVPNQIDSGL